MQAEAARVERLGKLAGLPPPLGAVDEVLAQNAAVLADAAEKPSPPPMDEFLNRLTACLLGPCTAPGVPSSVPGMVRRSLQSVGWNVATNLPSEGAALPSLERVTAMVAAARQELVMIAGPQTPKAPSGGSSLKGVKSFSFNSESPAFIPGQATVVDNDPYRGRGTGGVRGGGGVRGRGGGRGGGRAPGGRGGRGAKVCRFDSKCTRADCYFSHPGRDSQAPIADYTEDDPVLAALAAELAALDALENEDDLPPTEDFEAFLAMSGQAADRPRQEASAGSLDVDDEFERAQEEWLASQA